jgi:hypothetical protein
VVIVQGEASEMEVIANTRDIRDIDEYNRRGVNDTTRLDEEAYANDYEEYEYTDRIVRFHDPESSIKITGADEVIVYFSDDVYDNYYNRGWSSFYSWYDPWYYGGWYGWYSPWYYVSYSPWYYGGWYSPWYYSGWHGWHIPWYYRSCYYGYWYDPWYYGAGFLPYGGWYDPYYGYGVRSAYYYGYSDGYYSSLTRNRSGRSSGIYRTSSANRTSSATASLSGRNSTSGRTSTLSGRSSSATRSTVSGRSASALSNRGSSTASRTRIIDSSGRAYDARTGVAVDRSNTSSRSSSAVA